MRIEELRHKLLINGVNQPFDIFDICSRFGDLDIKSVPFKTNGLRGMAIIADKDSSLNCILVNSNLDSSIQNFHGFHELMHICFASKNQGQTFTCYDKVQPHQNKYSEWLANEGAAELLVPYKELLPLIKSNYAHLTQGIGTFEFCEKISSKFRVSPTVIQNRIISLAYEIKQYISGVDIDNIRILSKNQQIKENINLKSLVDLEEERILATFKSSNV